MTSSQAKPRAVTDTEMAAIFKRQILQQASVQKVATSSVGTILTSGTASSVGTLLTSGTATNMQTLLTSGTATNVGTLLTSGTAGMAQGTQVATLVKTLPPQSGGNIIPQVCVACY